MNNFIGLSCDDFSMQDNINAANQPSYVSICNSDLQSLFSLVKIKLFWSVG